MAVPVPCLRCRAVALVEAGAPTAACPSCGLVLPPPGAPAWFTTRDGSQQFGPYTIAQLTAYVAGGQVLPTDGVWHQGAPGWTPIGQLPALAPGGGPAIASPGAVPVVGQAPAMPGHEGFYGPPLAGGPHALASQGPGLGARALFHLQRALGWDLRAVVVEPAERGRLLALSVDEEDARRYLCWRQSVLWVVAVPTLVAAILATVSALTTDASGLSGLGVFLEIVRIGALYALPLTAFLAARTWDRQKRSRGLLLRGWLFAFLTPLVVALFPLAWRIDLSGSDANTAAQAEGFLRGVGAIAVYVSLMPAVLSLIPGVIRACLRVKALLPESILPGWFLVASAPLYVLLFLVTFSTVNQVAGNALLIVALLALLGAPVLYMMNAPTFTRPLHSPEDIARLGKIQGDVRIVLGIGVILLVTYVFTGSVLGQDLVGAEAGTSLMRPWDPGLLQLPIEYFARSLFTTVLVADLFLIMNLSVSRHGQTLATSPQAAAYERLMSEIEEAGERS